MRKFLLFSVLCGLMGVLPVFAASLNYESILKDVIECSDQRVEFSTSNSVNCILTSGKEICGREALNVYGDAMSESLWRAVRDEVCKFSKCNKDAVLRDGKCIKTNPKCKYKGKDEYASIGDEETGWSCKGDAGNVNVKLSSEAGLKDGALCKVKCEANGWRMMVIPGESGSCQGSWKAKQDGSGCTEGEDSNACKYYGGTWTNDIGGVGIGKCACPKEKGLKQTADGKSCMCDEGFEFDDEERKCTNADGRTKKEQNKYEQDKIKQKKANQAYANNKKACENSGGEWSGGKCKCDDTKSMKVSGVECTCIAGYKWKGADKKMGCEMEDETRLQTACNAAPQGTTKWNLSSKRCDCVNSNQTFNGTECKDNEDYAECKPLVASGVATWDAKREQKCMCNRQGYIIENGKCVESQDAKDKRLAKEAEDKLKASRRKIEDAHANLTRMVDGFKVSVWKDEEGKFNTARLASDAIAGVVLGTVGGVVTSSVVKKNQVENGFEDLKCTIGGQVVAEWGDEFRVGIQ